MSSAAVAEELLNTVNNPPSPPNLPYSGRLGLVSRTRSRLTGGPVHRRLARAATIIPMVRHYEQLYGKQSDTELLSKANQLRRPCTGRRYLQAVHCRGLRALLGRGLAGARHAGLRRPAGGRYCHVQGSLCELATGEGKTLTATFPVFDPGPGRARSPRRHRQRLPRQARRRADGSGLRSSG